MQHQDRSGFLGGQVHWVVDVILYGVGRRCCRAVVAVIAACSRDLELPLKIVTQEIQNVMPLSVNATFATREGWIFRQKRCRLDGLLRQQ